MTTALSNTSTTVGTNCQFQTLANYWPVGALPTGGAFVGSPDYVATASSLTLSASGFTGLGAGWPGSGCGPLPTGFSHAGAVTVLLTAPYDVAVEVSVTGATSHVSLGGITGSTEVFVDGSLLGAMGVGSGASVNQTSQVLVGPSGVQLRLAYSASAQAVGVHLFLTDCTVTWAPLDAAAVTSVPGGCAPPTANPLFVETGLPRVGGSIEADLVQARGRRRWAS